MNKESLEQQKLMNVFELIKYLHKQERTMEDCRQFIGCTLRTAYNYINLLKAVGFDIIKKTITPINSNKSHIITYQIEKLEKFLEIPYELIPSEIPSTNRGKLDLLLEDPNITAEEIALKIKNLGFKNSKIARDIGVSQSMVSMILDKNYTLAREFKLKMYYYLKYQEEVLIEKNDDVSNINHANYYKKAFHFLMEEQLCSKELIISYMEGLHITQKEIIKDLNISDVTKDRIHTIGAFYQKIIYYYFLWREEEIIEAKKAIRKIYNENSKSKESYKEWRKKYNQENVDRLKAYQKEYQKNYIRKKNGKKDTEN